MKEEEKKSTNQLLPGSSEIEEKIARKARIRQNLKSISQPLKGGDFQNSSSLSE